MFTLQGRGQWAFENKRDGHLAHLGEQWGTLELIYPKLY